MGALLTFLRGLLCGAGGDATEKNRRDEHLFPPAATPGFNSSDFFCHQNLTGFFPSVSGMARVFARGPPQVPRFVFLRYPLKTSWLTRSTGQNNESLGLLITILSCWSLLASSNWRTPGAGTSSLRDGGGG